MKKFILIPFVLIAAFLFTGLGVVFGQTVTVGSQTILQGGIATIDISISGFSNAVDGFNFILDFDPDGLDASVPTTTLPDSANPAIWGSSVDNASGTASAYYDNYGSPNADGIISSIVFSGIDPGIYPLIISFSEFFSGYDEITPDTFIDGSITVNAVPIPSTILLLGGGLAALVGLRRRRS